MVYILGELFLVPHDIGAEIMSISKDNFRYLPVYAEEMRIDK